ncbi:hypothetical protein SFIMM107S_05143 [Streptomyces griseus]
MRVGTFVLAAQFPGQGQGETLHRAVRSAEVAEESELDSCGWPNITSYRTACARPP